jgi:hypothetical protein
VVVGRLQQWTWTAEDGSARSVAEGLGRATALGDRHARPGHQERQRLDWVRHPVKGA